MIKSDVAFGVAKYAQMVREAHRARPLPTITDILAHFCYVEGEVSATPMGMRFEKVTKAFDLVTSQTIILDAGEGLLHLARRPPGTKIEDIGTALSNDSLDPFEQHLWRNVIRPCTPLWIGRRPDDSQPPNSSVLYAGDMTEEDYSFSFHVQDGSGEAVIAMKIGFWAEELPGRPRMETTTDTYQFNLDGAFSP